MAKSVVLDAAPDPMATDQLAEHITRHEPLLDRCVTALQRGAVSSRDLVATLDEVFGDAKLAAALGFDFEPALGTHQQDIVGRERDVILE